MAIEEEQTEEFKVDFNGVIYTSREDLILAKKEHDIANIKNTIDRANVFVSTIDVDANIIIIASEVEYKKGNVVYFDQLIEQTVAYNNVNIVNLDLSELYLYDIDYVYLEEYGYNVVFNGNLNNISYAQCNENFEGNVSSNIIKKIDYYFDLARQTL